MIDKALEIPETDLLSLERQWVSMVSEINALRETVKKAGMSNDLKKISIEVDSSATRFTAALARMKTERKFGPDWERFALRDAISLKDWLLGLREYLIRHSDELSVAMFRYDVDSVTGVDPLGLFRELRALGLIGEGTWLRLKESFACSEVTEEVSRMVRKIALLFLEIMELREAGYDLQRGPA